MAEKEPPQQPQRPQRALVPRSVLEQNRDFYDQFFTKVVKTRFKVASDESAIRHMNIIVGSCTAARCQLTADSHLLVLMASQMSSTSPEIQVTYTAPEGDKRPPVQNILRYQTPNGWIRNPGGKEPGDNTAVGDLTTWTDLTIADFLDWSSLTPS